jgi:hypothetical protein
MTGKDHAEFQAEPGYWMEGGTFSVIWLNCPKGRNCPSDNAWFKNFVPTAAKQIIQNLNNSSNESMRLTFLSGKMIQVNGKSAYQFIAKGTVQNIPAIWIETDINFKGSIGMAALLQEVDPNKSIQSQINWAQYTPFVNSLKKIG